MPDIRTEILARIKIDLEDPAAAERLEQVISDLGPEIERLGRQAEAAVAPWKKQREAYENVSRVLGTLKSGILSLGAALGVNTNIFSGAIAATLEYNKAVVTTYRSVERFGVSMAGYRKSIGDLRGTFKSTYSEAMQLQKALMDINVTFSPNQAAALGRALYNVTGANADAARELASTLGQVASMRPMLANLFGGVANDVKGAADALKLMTADMAIAGTLSDDQVAAIDALVTGKEREKTGTEKQIDLLNKQNEAVQKIRQVFEDLTLAIGAKILPIVEKMIQYGGLIRTIIEIIIVGLAVVKAYIFYIEAQEKAITASFMQQQRALVGIQLQKALAAESGAAMAAGARGTAVGLGASNVAAGTLVSTLGPIVLIFAAVAALIFAIKYAWNNIITDNDKLSKQLADQQEQLGDMRKGVSDTGAKFDETDEEFALRQANKKMQIMQTEYEQLGAFDDEEKDRKRESMARQQAEIDTLTEKANKAKGVQQQLSTLTAQNQNYFNAVRNAANQVKGLNAELERQKALADASGQAFEQMITRYGGGKGTDEAYTKAKQDLQNLRQANKATYEAMEQNMAKFAAAAGAKKFATPEQEAKAYQQALQNYNASMASLEARTDLDADQKGLMAQGLTATFVKEGGQRAFAETQAKINELKNRERDYANKDLELTKQKNDFNKPLLEAEKTKASLLETQISLADTLGVGLKSQIRDRLELVRNIEKQKKLLDEEIAQTEKEALAAAKLAKASPDNPEYQRNARELNSQLNQKLDERTKMLQKQAEITKSLREGWISAIQAMTSGAGVFTRIVIKEQQGLGVLAEKRKDALKALQLGQAGAGETGRVSSGRRTLTGFEEGEAGSAETKILQQYLNPSAPLNTRVNQIDKTLTQQLQTQKMVVEAIQAANKTGAVAAETPGAPGAFRTLTSGGGGGVVVSSGGGAGGGGGVVVSAGGGAGGGATTVVATSSDAVADVAETAAEVAVQTVAGTTPKAVKAKFSTYDAKLYSENPEAYEQEEHGFFKDYGLYFIEGAKAIGDLFKSDTGVDRKIVQDDIERKRLLIEDMKKLRDIDESKIGKSVEAAMIKGIEVGTQAAINTINRNG